MNDLLSRMLMRVTQASPVEPVLPSRYERAGGFEGGETFEPGEGKTEVGIESRPMTRGRAEQEDADVFAVPARKMARRRSAEAEQGEESSRAAELRGFGEALQREALDEGLSRRETQHRGTAEVVRPEAMQPVRDERAPSVREVRIERDRVAPLPENPSLRALSPISEVTKQAGPTEVHVTIGHIEVHAAAAPAKAPVRRAAPPSVSLQDYLSRRNGGSR